MEPILLSSSEEGLFYLEKKSNIDIIILNLQLIDNSFLNEIENYHAIIGIGNNDNLDNSIIKGHLTVPIEKKKLLKLFINIL